VRKDRTVLFPIMPIDWYHGMADDDVLSVVAYLRSLPPAKNRVPEREPSFVAKALFAMNVLKPMDPVTSPVVAPPRGVTPEYGKYLASNLAGCADCHTPRNLQNGQFYLDSMFAGSTIAFGEPEGDPIRAYARNITPDVETGIGSWNEEQFVAAVTSGMRPDGRVLSPHMPYAYYKFWTPEDLRAVYAYLKTIPAIRRSVPGVEYASQMMSARGVERGKLLFHSRCQACHGENGSGAPPTKVVLAEVSSSMTGDELIDVVKTGYAELKMPAFGKTLQPDELADLVAFIKSWEKR
jgi:mono/diheme cytochrome c family protein